DGDLVAVAADRRGDGAARDELDLAGRSLLALRSGSAVLARETLRAGRAGRQRATNSRQSDRRRATGVVAGHAQRGAARAFARGGKEDRGLAERPGVERAAAVVGADKEVAGVGAAEREPRDRERARPGLRDRDRLRRADGRQRLAGERQRGWADAR